MTDLGVYLNEIEVLIDVPWFSRCLQPESKPYRSCWVHFSDFIIIVQITGYVENGRNIIVTSFCPVRDDTLWQEPGEFTPEFPVLRFDISDIAVISNAEIKILII